MKNSSTISLYIGAWLLWDAHQYPDLRWEFLIPALVLFGSVIWEAWKRTSEEKEQEYEEDDEPYYEEGPPKVPEPEPSPVSTPIPTPRVIPPKKSQIGKSGVKKLEWNIAPTEPPSYQKFRSCELKRPYNTLEAAEQAVRNLQQSGRDLKPHKPLTAYKCDYCHKFHVGHVVRVKA
jgi:hypothetical protein